MKCVSAAGPVLTACWRPSDCTTAWLRNVEVTETGVHKITSIRTITSSHILFCFHQYTRTLQAWHPRVSVRSAPSCCCLLLRALRLQTLAQPASPHSRSKRIVSRPTTPCCCCWTIRYDSSAFGTAVEQALPAPCMLLRWIVARLLEECITVPVCATRHELTVSTWLPTWQGQLHPKAYVEPSAAILLPLRRPVCSNWCVITMLPSSRKTPLPWQQLPSCMGCQPS